MSDLYAELDGLVSLLAASVETIKESYNKVGHGIPSLDDPMAYPVDDVVRGPDWTRAVKTIQAATLQLSRLVTHPRDVAMTAAFETLEPACIRVVLDTRLADHLLAHPSGLHVSALSELTGVEAGKLARVLRFLTHRHFFREVDRDTFANNRLSIQLLPGNPIAAFVGHLTEETFKALVELSPNLLDPESGPSYAPNKSPWSRAYNFDGPYWEYLSQVPRLAERFGLAMLGVSQGATGGLLSGFPWSSLPDGTTFCDVGGGVGSMSLALIEHHPHMHIILEDLPEPIAQAKNLWAEKAADAVKTGKVEFKVLDFFKDSPKEGCDIYYMRGVLHDWPDKECQVILSNVARAMRPSSRLLNHGFVLRNPLKRDGEQMNADYAPEPLLPNWGEGGLMPYRVDIDMMALLNSKERLFEEFVNLGAAAGLEFVKLWEVGETSLIEFKLREKQPV